MTPRQIGVTYRRVAEIRQVDLQQLVAQVRTNFNLLFGHQLRGGTITRGVFIVCAFVDQQKGLKGTILVVFIFVFYEL